MSTPNTVTEDQILQQLLAAEQMSQQQNPTNQQVPPPLPTVPKLKVGDKEYDVTDTAGIQAAIKTQQDEFARMQTLLAEQQTQQTQQQHVPQPQQQRTQQAPPAQTRKKSWTPDTLAEELKSRDLPSVFDEMLGQQLGVDSLLSVFNGMAQKQMLQEAAFLKIAEKVDGLDGRLTQESKERASENFLGNHEDYVPTPENLQMIESYLRKDNLQWTPAGLHLAYLHAKSDNMLKLAQANQQAQQVAQPQHSQQLAQPQQATSQPSLRGGSAAVNSENAILDKFNSLSLEAQRDFIETFGG